jgi:hypothetical protein
LVVGLLFAVSVFVGAVVPMRLASAHPGGLDAQGCHTCRTNCTEVYGIPYGFYHTHINGQSVPCGSTGSVTPTSPPPPPRDTTPPPAPTHTGSTFDPFNGIAKLTITAENGSALVGTSNVAGVVYEGVGTGAAVPIEFRVPEGTHQVTFTARDAAGNVSVPSAPVTVTNPPLVAPRLSLASKPGRLPVLIAVTAPANATVNVSGSPVPVAGVPMGTGGSATMTIASLPDGQHTLTAQYGDGQGRTSPPATLAVVVDTAPPRLGITIDKKAAKRGLLKYAIETEPGARVTVRGTAKLKKNYTAGSAPIKRSVALDDGRYKLTIVAADATGNESTETLAVNVTS